MKLKLLAKFYPKTKLIASRDSKLSLIKQKTVPQWHHATLIPIKFLFLSLLCLYTLYTSYMRNVCICINTQKVTSVYVHVSPFSEFYFLPQKSGLGKSNQWAITRTLTSPLGHPTLSHRNYNQRKYRKALLWEEREILGHEEKCCHIHTNWMVSKLLDNKNNVSLYWKSLIHKDFFLFRCINRESVSLIHEELVFVSGFCQWNSFYYF